MNKSYFPISCCLLRSAIALFALLLSLHGADCANDRSRPILTCEKSIEDFGNRLYYEPFQYVFTFCNTGGSTLIISDVKTNCGCTSNVLSGNTLSPGKCGYISVGYAAHPTNLKHGRQEFIASLETNDPDNGLFDFKITANLTKDVVVKPEEIHLDNNLFNGKETNPFHGEVSCWLDEEIPEVLSIRGSTKHIRVTNIQTLVISSVALTRNQITDWSRMSRLFNDANLEKINSDLPGKVEALESILGVGIEGPFLNELEKMATIRILNDFILGSEFKTKGSGNGHPESRREIVESVFDGAIRPYSDGIGKSTKFHLEIDREKGNVVGETVTITTSSRRNPILEIPILGRLDQPENERRLDIEPSRLVFGVLWQGDVIEKTVTITGFEDPVMKQFRIQVSDSRVEVNHDVIDNDKIEVRVKLKSDGSQGRLKDVLKILVEDGDPIAELPIYAVFRE